MNRVFGTFSLILWASKYLRCPRWKIHGKNICNFYFSDFKRIFSILGGVVTKNAFSKMFPIFKDDFFDTWLTLWQHPQQVFCCFNNIFFKIFGKQINFSIFWVFIHHPSKFGSFSLKIGGEIICQTWPLQTLFSQLTHSVLKQGQNIAKIAKLP